MGKTETDDKHTDGSVAAQDTAFKIKECKNKDVNALEHQLHSEGATNSNESEYAKDFILKHEQLLQMRGILMTKINGKIRFKCLCFVIFFL